MDINDAACASSQARLDKCVVLLEVVLVEGAGKHVVGQELPANRETEDVEAVVVDEVLHLAGTIVTVVGEQRRPGTARSARTIGVASEVEPGDVDTGELEGTSRRGGGARRRGSTAHA